MITATARRPTFHVQPWPCSASADVSAGQADPAARPGRSAAAWRCRARPAVPGLGRVHLDAGRASPGQLAVPSAARGAWPRPVRLARLGAQLADPERDPHRRW
jgi:hypothetical protein